MAIVNKAALTSVFEQGDVPQGSDFASLIESNLNLAETGTQSVAGSITVIGSLSATGGITTGGALNVGVQTLAGNGTVQGTAAVINSTLIIAMNNASNYAYILPATTGAFVWFQNTGAETALVFPPVGSRIDEGSIDASVEVYSGWPGLFICESATQYRSLQSVIQSPFA